MTPQRLNSPLPDTPSREPEAVSHRDALRTTCGREFTIGTLRLDRLAHPAGRVFLSTRLRPEDHEVFWASFTADEARRLADRLLAHAAAAEGEMHAQAAALAVDLTRRAERFLARHETRRDELRVEARHAAADEPAGREALIVTVTTPPSLSAERRNALRALLRREIQRNPACRAALVHVEVVSGGPS